MNALRLPIATVVHGASSTTPTRPSAASAIAELPALTSNRPNFAVPPGSDET